MTKGISFSDMAVHAEGRKYAKSTQNKGFKISKSRVLSEEENSSTGSEIVPFYRHGSIHSCPSLDSDSYNGSNLSDVLTSSSTPCRKRYTSLSLSEYNNDGFKVALCNKFGKRGSANGCLQNATGIVHLYSGAVLVTDMILSRITLFAENGRFRSQFSTGQSNEPWDCDIFKTGTIVCTIGQEHCIAMYSLEGYLIRKIGGDILVRPRGISKCGEKRVIVTDTSLNDVLVFDFTGHLIVRLRDENRYLKFNQPRYVTTTDDGMILVSDSGNHSIHIFTKEGKLLTTFGGYGRENGDLRFPYGVVSDTDGYIYVCDHYNNRVSMFTSSGTFLRHVITPEMRLKRPQGLTMCKTMTNKILYVTHGDLKAHEVAVYRINSESNKYSVSVNAFV